MAAKRRANITPSILHLPANNVITSFNCSRTVQIILLYPLIKDASSMMHSPAYNVMQGRLKFVFSIFLQGCNFGKSYFFRDKYFLPNQISSVFFSSLKLKGTVKVKIHRNRQLFFMFLPK